MTEKEIGVNKGLQDFIILSKYSRHLPDKKRRETWDEAVDRVMNMHLEKFKDLPNEDKNDIRWAFGLVKDKCVLPSMRSIQFGGKAVFAHNARIYNCSVRHLDSIRAFAELGYLMLCGCGTGIGLYKKYLNRLPDLVGPNDKTGTVFTYVIEDTIEGWADSLEALLSCYTKNNSLSGRKIVFDYSKIRKKGSLLKTGGGKAPGYKPLKTAHKRIKDLLDFIIETKDQTRLRSVDAYDVLMHFADSVLSGGVRRTASAVMFDYDDFDMMRAKTDFEVKKHRGTIDEETNEYHGRVWANDTYVDVVFNLNDSMDKWSYENLINNKRISWRKIEPQRARSNNSIRLLRNNCTLQQFSDIIECSRQYGEPGFVFSSNEDSLYNPCQHARAKLLTPNGIRELCTLGIGDTVWSENGWTKITNKWSTGLNKVYKYKTTAGTFYGTENHKLVSNREKIKAKDCDSIDIITGPFNNDVTLDKQDVMDGLVLGDGSVHTASNNLIYLCIGQDDNDYHRSEIKELILKHRPGLTEHGYEIKTTLSYDEIPLTYKRKIPDRFLLGDRNKVCGFLRGLYSAKGSTCGGRVTLKASSFDVIEGVQMMLSSVGIQSYFTTNKPTNVKFANGEYVCKQSYDLNITGDSNKFLSIIGFVQDYKTEKLVQLLDKKQYTVRRKTTFDIVETELISEEETFDITVDNADHTYWTQCCNVSNCYEIGFIPVLDGVCGVQFCNLSTINGSKVYSKEDFKNFVKAETIIGTLQATYTTFPYLSLTAKYLTEKEALLGNSITGILDSPDILLNEEYLREMSLYAVETNEIWANKLGINKAARISCVKPEGTGSLAVGAAPGIHAHHAKKYFKRIQMTRGDNIYEYFKLHNPHMVEESVWNTNTKEDVLTFPIVSRKDAITKDKLTAIQHLELIKKVQQNWVLPSHKNNNIETTHNVSCTVIVKDNEWDEVVQYLFNNRDSFAAVSLLSYSGDKDYPQAPFEAVVTPEDEEKFNNLIQNYNHVDYQKLVENSDGTMHVAESSCAGGACLI